MAEQIKFPWGQYKTSELARVLGVTRGQVITAIRHLKIIEGGVRGKGIPADQTAALEEELRRIAADKTQRAARANEKRAAKAARRRAA